MSWAKIAMIMGVINVAALVGVVLLIKYSPAFRGALNLGGGGE